MNDVQVIGRIYPPQRIMKPDSGSAAVIENDLKTMNTGRSGAYRRLIRTLQIIVGLEAEQRRRIIGQRRAKRNENSILHAAGRRDDTDTDK